MGKVKALRAKEQEDEFEAWLGYEEYLSQADHLSTSELNDMERSSTESMKLLMEEYRIKNSISRDQHFKWSIDMLKMQVKYFTSYLNSEE